jgi:hypothetical protein
VTCALNQSLSPAALLSPNDAELAAADPLFLALVALVLVGPLLMPGLVLFALSSARAAVYFAKRSLHVIADKIVEALLILLLILLAGVPALEFVVRAVLALLQH